jgi:hypothetical protein
MLLDEQINTPLERGVFGRLFFIVAAFEEK